MLFKKDAANEFVQKNKDYFESFHSSDAIIDELEESGLTTSFPDGNTYIYKAKTSSAQRVDNHGYKGYISSGSTKLYREKGSRITEWDYSHSVFQERTVQFSPQYAHACRMHDE
ncbi:hypothetical protein [uncultured Methanolobus sp.]|uniref:hypothetical protein n=1 Tax=uncultured Methanolobus sp. TaxID=218300 RepID=UPI0029C81289|nr:hypothetical protein [uncultured Methanolobus sp.]